MNKLINIIGKSFFCMLIFRFIKLFNILYLRIFSIAAAKYYFPNAENLTMDCRVLIKYKKNISIGSNVIIGEDSQLGGLGGIKIGSNVRFSRGVIMETAGLNFRAGLPYVHNSKPIVIEDSVWLGTNAIVLGGVTIGKNSIIGAGVVISKSVPENSVVVSSENRTLKI